MRCCAVSVGTVRAGCLHLGGFGVMQFRWVLHPRSFYSSSYDFPGGGCPRISCSKAARGRDFCGDQDAARNRAAPNQERCPGSGPRFTSVLFRGLACLG